MSETGVELRLSQEVSPLARFVGRSEAAERARKFAARVAHSDHTLLILGATGSGKDHLAKIIHDLGRGAEGRPFVHVDCKALPEPLLEDELFGHTRGAFTNATEGREGLLRRAGDGTVFMNEVGNMGDGLQAKLLHVLDGQPFRPVGSDREVVMRARIVAATNANLAELVRQGRFRQDLFYRLNAVPFVLPSLRERSEDIGPLMTAIINGDAGRFDAGALEVLRKHDWPGNIRELTNLLKRAVLVNDTDGIGAEDVRRYIRENDPRLTMVEADDSRVKLSDPPPTWRELDRMYFAHVWRVADGDTRRVAEITGLSRKTVYSKANMYGLREE